MNPAAQGPARPVRDRWHRLLPPASPWLPYAAWMLLLLAFASVNAVSVAADLAARNSPDAAWEPYCWEYTSWLGSALAFVPAWLGTAWLGGPRPRNLPLRIASLAALTAVYSAVHVAAMAALRWATYRAVGWHYRFGPIRGTLIYEYRKDLLTFVLLAAVLTLWRRYPRPTAPQPAPAPAREPTFLITEKSALRPIRATQIDWVEAQGNYVALHVAGRAHLLRHPMKHMEATLAPWSFLRTHRSALVNAGRITRVIRADAGDWIELAIATGETERAPLSESRRAEILRHIGKSPPDPV